MGSLASIHQPTPNQVQLRLRQNSVELVRFVVFVLSVVGALLLLMPRARTSPASYLGAVGVAFGWSLIAATAREAYLFDRMAQTVSVRRSLLFWTSGKLLSMTEVAAVQEALSGPDNNRLVLELVTDRGKVLLRIPRRLTTLDRTDRSTVGRLIAVHLGVPFRSAD